MKSWLALLVTLLFLFITFYICGYLLLYGSILEFILGNWIWGLLRICVALDIFWMIWAWDDWGCKYGLFFGNVAWWYFE